MRGGSEGAGRRRLIRWSGFPDQNHFPITEASPMSGVCSIFSQLLQLSMVFPIRPAFPLLLWTAVRIGSVCS